MRLNGRKLTISDSTLTYGGREYPLAGAQATDSEQRRGIPGLTRRTVHHVQITGPGWAISSKTGLRGVPRFVRKLNERAAVAAGITDQS
jgi:hypothetical protein